MPLWLWTMSDTELYPAFIDASDAPIPAEMSSREAKCASPPQGATGATTIGEEGGGRGDATFGGGGVFLGGGGGRWNIGLADGVHVVVVCGVHASVT